MRITQGMMKPSSMFKPNTNQMSKLMGQKGKKKKTPLQALMDQKKKVADQLKNLDKKNLSASEKQKVRKQLKAHLKQIEETIKLAKEKEEKKKSESKKMFNQSKYRVAQIRSDAFNIMISGRKNSNNQSIMNENVKSINNLIALQKLNTYKKTDMVKKTS